MGKTAKDQKSTVTRTTRTTPQTTRTLRQNPKKSRKGKQSENDKKRKEKIRKLQQQIIDSSDDNYFDEDTSFSDSEEVEDDTILSYRGIFELQNNNFNFFQYF